MYIKTLLTAATAAAAFAATVPATAQVSPAEAQLAQSIGVEVGQYSLSQLVELKSLSTEDRSEALNQIDFIKDNAGAVSRDANSMSSAQFSRSLGVEPGTLNTAELQRLQVARMENDGARIQYILGGTQRAGDGANGKAQLAASLGVNADAYTLSELVTLQSRLVNDER